MLTPEKSIITLVSKIVEEQEKELSKERWYGTPFVKRKLDDEFIAKLQTILPTDSEPIGYPPVNEFIPKTLIEKKRARDPDSKPECPKKIFESPIVWFKQDDSFDQPVTYCQIKMLTTDQLYPQTPLS